jgi:hypothetical protein
MDNNDDLPIFCIIFAVSRIHSLSLPAYCLRLMWRRITRRGLAVMIIDSPEMTLFITPADEFLIREIYMLHSSITEPVYLGSRQKLDLLA